MSFAALLAVAALTAAETDLPRLKAEAARVRIVRDDWGIAHVHGHTDADAVFGMVYAQAEDDFSRIEANYLTALGRTAEAADAKPEAIWADLRQRLFVDPEDLKIRYASSPAWLKALMNGWADGLNFYLATHPDVHPKVLTRFEPWMALSFTEGSIGGDIERISLKALQAFYETSHARAAPPPPLLSRTAGEVGGLAQQVEPEGGTKTARLAPSVSRFARAASPAARERSDPERYIEPTGSNGIAIAPKNTKSGHALLLINPHTSFYFRSELQMSSDEGMNAYGAATWGQPFLYQGFNPHLGFMHTSSGVDSVDEFALGAYSAWTSPDSQSPWAYFYAGGHRPYEIRRVILRYRTASGALESRTFTTYRSVHGPIVREDATAPAQKPSWPATQDSGAKWIAVSLMYRPVEALSQSFLRAKATDLKAFLAVADRYKANSSNNTIFADDKGEIAYLHPQFIPRRDDRFDYRRPVDGADPVTAWKGDTPFEATPHIVNPRSGFVYNSNDEPWNAAGLGSLSKAAFPKYMDQAGWNPRGPHALRVLAGRHDFTMQSLNAAAYDPYLPEFAILIPKLLAAYDDLPVTDPLKAKLAEPVKALRGWGYAWGADSVPTSVAVFYGEQLFATSAPLARAAGIPAYEWMDTRVTAADRLRAFASAVDKLNLDFGTWRTSWSEINRYQRLDDAIVPHFDDAKPSIPVPFTSSQWGSLASFGLVPNAGTKKRYGNVGNSFVAVVEFGPRVKAVAVTAGGESGDPASRHFTDEAQRYAGGNLRPVYFWPDELKGHVERSYRPGE